MSFFEIETNEDVLENLKYIGNVTDRITNENLSHCKSRIDISLERLEKWFEDK